jgi:CRP-like cAMP-binding protein
MAAFDSKAFLEQAGEGRTVLLYKKGANIFKQGEPAGHVYYLQRGSAAETITSETGDQAIVGMIEAGTFFGNGATDGIPRSTTVTPMEPCVVTEITRDAMVKALNKEEFRQLFLTYLSSRLSDSEAERAHFMLHPIEKRLAKKLLDLSHVIEGGPSRRIDSAITQEHLAKMIGTSRTQVNRHLNKFRRGGMIHYLHGTQIIVAPTLLRLIHGEKDQ